MVLRLRLSERRTAGSSENGGEDQALLHGSDI
jgi:hypothetical protein